MAETKFRERSIAPGRQVFSAERTPILLSGAPTIIADRSPFVFLHFTTVIIQIYSIIRDYRRIFPYQESSTQLFSV